MIADIMRKALAAIERGEPFALITVVESEGSSPGKPGHKMIVYSDGRQEGTVGGALVELRAREAAIEMIARGEGGLLQYELDADKPEGLDSVCGGRMTLVVEVVAPGTHILLCGGGHVSLSVARLCAELGYRHTIADARPEWAGTERFPHAAELAVQEPHDFIREAGTGRFSHIIIFTHDHHLDREALLAVFRSGFSGYTGMIGSKRKWAQIRTMLAEQGISEEQLDLVHCPVGLDIGAKTPAEIAVSIMAEIIKEKM